MMNNERLRSTIQSKLNTEFNSISKGKSKNINLTFAATIENGEGIIGYQYLHGTNASAGGFKIKGTATKDTDGKVVANLFFQWNDVIDPNFEYNTDTIKADIAKKIPGAKPTDYIIRVGWGIYHILPREYRGTNSYTNLIPVPRNLHESFITAWWNSYNKG